MDGWKARRLEEPGFEGLRQEGRRLGWRAETAPNLQRLFEIVESI